MMIGWNRKCTILLCIQTFISHIIVQEHLSDIGRAFIATILYSNKACVNESMVKVTYMHMHNENKVVNSGQNSVTRATVLI